MLVIMCGYSGGGKSTVGKMLAESLGWQFYDIDDTIPRSWHDRNAKGTGVTLTEIDGFFHNVFLPDVQKLSQIGSVIAVFAFAKADYAEKIRDVFPDTLILELKASLETHLDRVKNRQGFKVHSDIITTAYNDPDTFVSIEGASIINANRPLVEVFDDCLSQIRDPQNH